jgi:O-succinylbenzoic acid--CoA ligase
VHAFVSLHGDGDGMRASAEQLVAHCRPLLSDYKLPETFTLSHEPLPRNANGKLLKREMRDSVATPVEKGPAR